jgi:hypothetical protein
MITYIWVKAKSKTLPLVVSAAFAALIWLVMGSGFIEGCDRFLTQAKILKWFFASGNTIFGFGNGAFAVMAIKLVPVLDRYYVTTHSDLVRLFFEQGFIGLCLWCPVLLFALWNVRRNALLFSMLSGVLVLGVIQYPAFLAVHAFLSATIIVAALREGKNA